MVIDCDCEAKAPPCPDCKGSGWLVRKDKEGREFATPCHCRTQTLATRASSKVALGARFKNRTFETFEPSADNETALEESLKYVQSFERKAAIEGSGLWFFGPPGTGKTHLAAAILNALSNQGFYGLIVSTADLMKQLREAQRKDDGPSGGQILERVQTPPLVALDDLGAERVWKAPGAAPAETFVAESLYLMVNYRYEHGLPLIITSNQGPAEMEQRIGERIVDRLLEMCQPIRMSGESWRRRIREQRVQEREDGP